MVDLPYFRTAKTPPFTFCRVDMFCPFIIKQRKSQVKRYEAITICLSSQAVHFEKSHSLVTNSFILALNRLAARKENMQTNFSDNGNNFIGSKNELRSALEELDKEKLQFFCSAHSVPFSMNSSAVGGKNSRNLSRKEEMDKH